MVFYSTWSRKNTIFRVSIRFLTSQKIKEDFSSLCRLQIFLEIEVLQNNNLAQLARCTFSLSKITPPCCPAVSQNSPRILCYLSVFISIYLVYLYLIRMRAKYQTFTYSKYSTVHNVQCVRNTNTFTFEKKVWQF